MATREFTAAEKAHLRSLPDEKIAGLHHAGRLDEWYVAISEDPPAGNPTPTKAAPVPSAQPSARPVTRKTLMKVAERMGAAMREYVAGVINPQAAKIESLEERIKFLEERPALKYEGTWEARQYSVGSFVTHAGSMWYCREIASAADSPNASRCWKLAVKRGRDGMDAG